MCALIRFPHLLLSLFSGAAWLDAAPAPVAKASDVEQEVTLEPVEVTGSRLKRLQSDRPEFVLNLSVEQISRAGFSRPEEMLRQLPFSNGLAQDTSSPTTFQPGITSVSFRALGYASGLPLVNGRRIAPFGQAGAAQLGYDMASVPFAALERVEIAKDGASAVYGSDAVAGVINYRLRTEFIGTEVRSSYRQLEGTDWGFWSASLLHGARTDRLKLVVALDHDDNNSILYADRPISRSEDFRPLGGFDLRSPHTFPAHLVIPAGTPGVPAHLTGRLIAPGTVLPDGRVQLAPTTAPTIGSFVPLPAAVVNGVYTPGDTRNGLDRARYSTVVPRLHNTGAWVFAEFDAHRRLQLFLDASYRHRIVGTTYEPPTISLVGEVGFGDLPDGRIVFPAANPYNPFGIAIADLTFFLPESGPRDNEMTVTTPRVVAGARGELPGKWEWEIAGTYTHSRVFSRWTNFLSDRALQDGLAGRLGGWLNPFGPSDAGVVERMRTNLHDLQIARLWMGDARVSGTIWEPATGPVQILLGSEWRSDRFIHRPHELRGNGGLVSLARRPPRNLHRNLIAGFAELAVPLGQKADVTAAVRWEHYGDFGDPVKPKIATRWEALPGLTLRGSYSAAFRAPEMLQAYTDAQETFTQIADPRRPDLGVYTMRVLNGGNRALKPEETDVTYAGFTYAPPFLRGWSFGADYWHYDQRNLIGTLGAQNMLANEATLAPGRILRGPEPAPGTAGEVIQLNDTFGNYNRYVTYGVDIEAAYRTRLGAHELTANFTAVRLGSARRSTLGFGDNEAVNAPSVARWRANASFGWRRGAHDALVHLNHIGEQTGSAPSSTISGRISAMTLVNVSYGFAGPADTQWRIGANNLFDTDPPRNYFSRTGFQNGYYDSLGRVWFVSVARKF